MNNALILERDEHNKFKRNTDQAKNALDQQIKELKATNTQFDMIGGAVRLRRW